MSARRAARGGTLGDADLGVLPEAIAGGPAIDVWAPGEEPTQDAARRAWRAWRAARQAWAEANGVKPYEVPVRTRHPH